jgi:glucose-6-phosphate 1-dehydrogenase
MSSTPARSDQHPSATGGEPDLTAAEPTAPEAPDQPLVLVLHGARGDLARRSIYPALATLHRRGLLPAHWALLGTGRDDMADEEYRELVAQSLEEFGGDDGTDEPRAEALEALTRHSAFCSEVGDEEPGTLPQALDRVRGALAEAAGADAADVVVVHYLAVPPAAFEPLTRNLDRHGLARGTDGSADTVRVVYEKPYGTDPDSFRQLDAVVHEALEEQQVFRIDHFLGKEAVQNLHVLRFANELFASVWDARHVEQVQIDVPETLDVAQRAEFYDATGAALDMVVSHLFQVAAQVAMEPPKGMDIANLVAAREDAIACFRPLDPTDDVVLGQFDGYQDIEGVEEGSTTDTYIAARLWVDNNRWRGVPFLLRTGKRMAASAQRVTLVLRRDPEHLFGDRVEPGLISLSLQGDGTIEVTASVKKPGPDLDVASGTARLDLADVAEGEPLAPYASLLHDVLVGDRTLFTTPEGLEHAWRAFEPMLGGDRPDPLPYEPGSWGPAEAARLAAPHGWIAGG